MVRLSVSLTDLNLSPSSLGSFKKVDIKMLYFIYLLTMHFITLRCTVYIAKSMCDTNCRA